MKDIPLLTAKQELDLLDLVVDRENNSGAGRVVYPVRRDELAAIGIDVPCSCVIKVALGVPGQNQNDVECNAFEEFGHSYPLARIFMRGHFIEVMERIVPLEEEIGREYDGFETSTDYADEFIGDGSTYTYEQLMEVFETATQLEDINGVTGDNGQLGYNCEGALVAYDYGYQANSDTSFCSDITVNNTDMHEYFDLLKQFLITSDFVACHDALLDFERERY